MQRFFSISLLVTSFIAALLIHSLFAAEALFAAEGSRPIALPKNPKAVVVSLDYDGGFASPPPGHPPVILVRANGTVETSELFGKKKPKRFKISAKEVESLLQTIINENKFFEKDVASIQKKLKGNRHIADARGTIIIVNTGGKKKIHFPALSILAQQFKENKELQQLVAIEKLLLRLKIIVQAGGKKKVIKWLKIANNALKKKYPEASMLKLKNLHAIRLNKKGKRSYIFHRQQKKTVTTVTVTTPSNKKKLPKTTVVYNIYRPQR
ncbi:hypothetical protein MNBD_PLANCTO02-602 [hydrothermal vent metagenome]|uniref:Uncharacterized protein n=1 Tax=hydrothermal vent metagenome TaxID=652676 RepID=A0A3B1E0J9_9ZZZZ